MQLTRRLFHADFNGMRLSFDVFDGDDPRKIVQKFASQSGIGDAHVHFLVKKITDRMALYDRHRRLKAISTTGTGAEAEPNPQKRPRLFTLRIDIDGVVFELEVGLLASPTGSSPDCPCPHQYRSTATTTCAVAISRTNSAKRTPSMRSIWK